MADATWCTSQPFGVGPHTKNPATSRNFGVLFRNVVSWALIIVAIAVLSGLIALKAHS